MFAPWTATTVPALLIDFRDEQAPSDLGLTGGCPRSEQEEEERGGQVRRARRARRRDQKTVWFTKVALQNDSLAQKLTPPF